MLTYTEMNIGHYEDAYRLWKETEGMSITKGDSKETINEYLKRNPGMSFVCVDDNLLVGTILCGHDRRRGFIYHLAVRKDYQGKSIGKTLVEKSLSKLKSLGIDRCMIWVKTGNEKGHEFWRKSGWTKRDDLCVYSINLQQ